MCVLSGMNLFLLKLPCKKEFDEVIKSVAEKVLVLRFGRDEDSVCMELDEIIPVHLDPQNGENLPNAALTPEDSPPSRRSRGSQWAWS
ncbi:thioredoxin-like protein 4B [Polyodon spathula]|uniref:thioredoxin-like protein 4B n=1 Tax=Polyodon spathula TaxID=7913 RepID=UPI001B7DDFE6|nr:thioredoxin-like protein 4B [Polyodon spathula]